MEWRQATTLYNEQKPVGTLEKGIKDYIFTVSEERVGITELELRNILRKINEVKQHENKQL